MEEGEGGVKANRLPSHLRSSSSSFSSFDFVCARCWFPGRSFSARRQIPAVLTDSPDLITVNEAAKTFRSKWKTLKEARGLFFIFQILGWGGFINELPGGVRSIQEHQEHCRNVTMYFYFYFFFAPCTSLHLGGKCFYWPSAFTNCFKMLCHKNPTELKRLMIHLKSVKTASRWPEVKNDQREIRSLNKCYHKHLNHSPNFTVRDDVYQFRFSHSVTWTTWILFTVAWQRHQLLLDVSDWSSLSTN